MTHCHHRLSGRYPQSRDLGDYWKNLGGPRLHHRDPRHRVGTGGTISPRIARRPATISANGAGLSKASMNSIHSSSTCRPRAEYTDPQRAAVFQQRLDGHGGCGLYPAGLQAADDPDQALEKSASMSGDVWRIPAFLALKLRFAGSAWLCRKPGQHCQSRLLCAEPARPSMTLETMCSSSRDGHSSACQDLKLGRTSLAIAGGVNVTIHLQ